jgi:hypothetical protein
MNTEETANEYLYVDFSLDSYKPGDTLEGTVHWKFEGPAEHIDVSLMLEVSNKIKTEVIHPAGFRWEKLMEEGTLKFSFTLPEGPYTYYGKGFQINWYVEAQCPDFDCSDQAGFTLSPTSKAFSLSTAQE